MDWIKTKELVESLIIGELDSSELSHLEAEEVLYFIFHKHLEEKFPESKIDRYKKGPIDIVVTVDKSLPSSKLEDVTYTYQLFIECKHRGRILELDETAKVFLTAIKDAPDELCIVSRKGIGLQARVFASHFFNYGDGYALFRKIRFRQTSIDELLNLSQDNFDAQIVNYYKISWSFWARRLDQTRLITSSVRKSRQYLTIDSLTNYIISINENKGLSVSYLVIKRNSEEFLKIPRMNSQGIELIDNCCFEINFYILKDLHAVNFQNLSWVLKLVNGTEVDLAVDLAGLNWTISPLCDFILRSRKIEEHKLQFENKMPFITLVQGNAGVGKSFFCHKIVDQKILNGIRVKSVIITELTSNEMLVDILLPLIWPKGLNYSDEEQKKNIKEIVEAAIKKTIPHDIDKEELSKSIIKGKIPIHLIGEAIRLIVRILAMKGEPWLFYLKDCQYMSIDVTNNLNLLLAELSELPGQNIHFLFESRTVKEDQFAWKELLQKIGTTFVGRTEFITLEGYSKSDVVKALKPIVVGADLSSLADAIYKKAGGNPLFITQLMLLLERESILSFSPYDKTKYIVNDWVYLREKLIMLPSALEKLMLSISQAFFKAILPKLEDENSFVIFLIEKLYFRELEPSHKFKINQDKRTDFIFILNEYGLIRYSIDSKDYDFIHELIEVALIQTLRTLSIFRTQAREYFEKNTFKNYKDQYQMGRLVYDANYIGWAIVCFQESSSHAKKNNDYGFERLGLKSHYDILNLNKETSVSNLRNRVVLGIKLGTVEIQAGSQLQAIKHLDNLIDELETINHTFDSSGERDLYLIDLYTQKLVLATRTLQPLEFVKSWNAIFVNDIEINNLKRRYLFTRLILISCATNCTKIAIAAAQFIVDYFGTKDELIPYADIGRIYLQSSPMIALDYWLKGINAFKSERQRTHNLLNIIVGNYIAKNTLPSKSKIESLKKTLVDLGVINQQLRLGIVESLFYSARDEDSMAIGVCQKLLNKAKKYNQFFWVWKCHNNLAVLYYSSDKIDNAKEHISRAVDIVNNVFLFIPERDYKLSDCYNNSVLTTKFDIGNSKLPKSEYSGAFRIALHNASVILNDVKFKITGVPQKLKKDHSMMRIIEGKKLYFALE